MLQKRERIHLSLDGLHGPVTLEPSEFHVLHLNDRPAGSEEQWGPDLALLGIAQRADVLEAAGKSFYDLTRRRAGVLATISEPPPGLWLIVASPHVWVEVGTKQPDERATGITVGLAAMAGPRLLASTIRNGFDYVDLPLFRLRDYNPPPTYGGVSGAGLWHVGLTDEAGRIHWHKDDDVLLGGVAFNHIANCPSEQEAIRCHGRISIYKHLLGTVIDAFPRSQTTPKGRYRAAARRPQRRRRSRCCSR